MIDMRKALFAICLVGIFAFNQPKTVKLDLSVEELNLIMEGLGELPAKKSEGLRAKIYMEAKKQLEIK